MLDTSCCLTGPTLQGFPRTGPTPPPARHMSPSRCLGTSPPGLCSSMWAVWHDNRAVCMPRMLSREFQDVVCLHAGSLCCVYAKYVWRGRANHVPRLHSKYFGSEHARARCEYEGCGVCAFTVYGQCALNVCGDGVYGSASRWLAMQQVVGCMRADGIGLLVVFDGVSACTQPATQRDFLHAGWLGMGCWLRVGNKWGGDCLHAAD